MGQFSYIDRLQKNVPTKMIFEFDKIIEEIPMIKSLTLFIYNPERPGRTFNLSFSNIPITWGNIKIEKKKVNKTKMKIW